MNKDAIKVSGPVGWITIGKTVHFDDPCASGIARGALRPAPLENAASLQHFAGVMTLVAIDDLAVSPKGVAA